MFGSAIIYYRCLLLLHSKIAMLQASAEELILHLVLLHARDILLHRYENVLHGGVILLY